MITIIKLNPQGEEKIRYEGTVIAQSPQSVVVEAYWTMTEHNPGYTRFEPGDRFIEHYYNHRWFNIFDISTPNGERKGWYCNIAEPARIFDDRIEQVDLFLDVWISTTGQPLILDEDEFTTATSLNAHQRHEAQQGLQTLLAMLETRQEVFSSLAEYL
jgi:predicted RNA-binding protein associated with RNAse of E/G family